MDLTGRKVVVADAEFDSLTPSRLWCLVAKEWPSGDTHVFRCEGGFDDLRKYAKTVDLWVGHKFLTFDKKYLKILEGVDCNEILDTLVLSRLLYAARPGGHSIENLGKKFSLDKPEIIEYDNYNRIGDYIERCKADVEINYRVFDEMFSPYVLSGEFDKAIKIEQDLDVICSRINENGFAFDLPRATILLEQITQELNKLTREIQESVGPVVDLVKKVKFKRKKDGQPDKRSLEFITNGWFTEDSKDGEEFYVYEEREFNPGSPKDRIELLNQSGWKPYIKTDTHKKKALKVKIGRASEKDVESLERLKVTGWKVCEENLETLPDDAPEGCVKLAEWLTLEGRKSDLEEWIAEVQPDGRIHGTIIHIGGWSQRAAHRKPNTGNIFSEFHGEANSPVKRIKKKYDAILRSLWVASKGRVLVGVDADSIQLRILAHLLSDGVMIEAISKGKKEDKTDIHNVNRDALNLPHLVRDHAKTFIYAWILGSSNEKVAQILECSLKEAKVAVNNFLKRYPTLDAYKNETLSLYWDQGWFPGLDGRKIMNPDSKHKILAGLLQNGEKIIMAKANQIWTEELDKKGVPYWQVNFVHDEWQTETLPEYAEEVKQAQCRALEKAGEYLNMLIPIVGEGRIGNNWLETH